jgi:hypothetical protein
VRGHGHRFTGPNHLNDAKRAHPGTDEAERHVNVSPDQPEEEAMRTPTHIRATINRNGASDAGATKRSMT